MITKERPFTKSKGKLIAQETFEDNILKINLVGRETDENRNESCLRTDKYKIE